MKNIEQKIALVFLLQLCKDYMPQFIYKGIRSFGNIHTQLLIIVIFFEVRFSGDFHFLVTVKNYFYIDYILL